MKITRSQLKKLIKEELNRVQESSESHVEQLPEQVLPTLPTWETVEEAYVEGWNTNHRDPYQGQNDVESDSNDSNARYERDEALSPQVDQE